MPSLLSPFSPQWLLVVDDVAVTPGTNEYPATITVTVTARNAAGAVVTTGDVAWGTADPDVATVQPTGPRTVQITGVGVGSTDVTAILGPVTLHLNVQVLAPAA